MGQNLYPITPKIALKYEFAERCCFRDVLKKYIQIINYKLNVIHMVSTPVKDRIEMVLNHTRRTFHEMKRSPQ